MGVIKMCTLRAERRESLSLLEHRSVAAASLRPAKGRKDVASTEYRVPSTEAVRCERKRRVYDHV